MTTAFRPQQNSRQTGQSPETRLVVTGTGIVSAYGVGSERFLAAVRGGESALRPIEAFDVDGCRCGYGARVPEVDLSHVDSGGRFRRAPRATRYTIAAADEALRAAAPDGLPWDLDRVGVCLGTYRGMTEVSEVMWNKLITSEPRFVPALLFQETVTNAVASAMSIRWGLRGTNYAISAGNSSGYQALYLAAQLLLSGRAEAMLCGGFDLFTEANHHDMDDLGMLSPTNSSRPFDARRDGFIMGEGAGVVVLETLAAARARQAPILAEIGGIGVGHDAYKFAANDPAGGGLALAMERALAAASVEPADIGYIGAAANSTPTLDRAEGAAIQKVFGPTADQVLVSSLKGTTGEAMAASDMFNLIACVAAVGGGRLPPQVGSDQLDPDCSLSLVSEANGCPAPDAALAHSYSYFGGNAAAVLVRRAQA